MMERRRRRLWTAKERTDLWLRWKRGESVSDIFSGARSQARHGSLLCFSGGWDCASNETASPTRAVVSGTRRDFSRTVGRGVDSNDRSESPPVGLDGEPRGYSKWWATSVSGRDSGPSRVATGLSAQGVQAFVAS